MIEPIAQYILNFHSIVFFFPSHSNGVSQRVFIVTPIFGMSISMYFALFIDLKPPTWPQPTSEYTWILRSAIKGIQTLGS